MSQERDTHFFNFGRLLYEELAHNVIATSHKRFAEMEAFKQEQATIIARYAYDLVHHTVEECHKCDMSYWDVPELVAAISDLTQWPT